MDWTPVSIMLQKFARNGVSTDRDEMLKSVIRGEIDYLPNLLPWEVDAFKAAPAFEVRQYALPITHVITFNPLSERIVNAQMRRALSFAIDREVDSEIDRVA